LNDLERRNGRYFALFQRIPVASGGSLRKSSRSLSHLLMSSCFHLSTSRWWWFMLMNAAAGDLTNRRTRCYRQHCAQRKASALLREILSFFFAPNGRHVAQMGDEIWHGVSTQGPHLRAKFHLNRCSGKGTGPPKLKILRNCKRLQGRINLRDFHEIYRVCISFQDALAVKI